MGMKINPDRNANDPYCHGNWFPSTTVANCYTSCRLMRDKALNTLSMEHGQCWQPVNTANVYRALVLVSCRETKLSVSCVLDTRIAVPYKYRVDWLINRVIVVVKNAKNWPFFQNIHTNSRQLYIMHTKNQVGLRYVNETIMIISVEKTSVVLLLNVTGGASGNSTSDHHCWQGARHWLQ